MNRDIEIQKNVMEELQWDPVLQSAEVGVTVRDGIVTLLGSGIINHIDVRPKLSPMIIKDVIKKALERSADIEASGINITTDGGRIVLKGKVRSWSERNEVERAVWATPGVIEVKDDLIIAP